MNKVVIIAALVSFFVGLGVGNAVLNKKVQDMYITKASCLDFTKEKVKENTISVIQQMASQQAPQVQSPIDTMLKMEMLDYYSRQNSPRLEIKDYFK